MNVRSPWPRHKSPCHCQCARFEHEHERGLFDRAHAGEFDPRRRAGEILALT
jgi:hypothetical protein